MIPTEIRLSPLESPLTLMGGKLASNSATTFDGRGEIEKKGFRDPGISSESAPETIDLGWIEAPEEPQAYASPIKFGVARLVRAVEQAKLANTLTGVLKAAFVNGQASPSGCVVDSSGAVIGGGGWAWMVPGSELGVGETTRMGAGERSVWAAQPLKPHREMRSPHPTSLRVRFSLSSNSLSRFQPEILRSKPVGLVACCRWPARRSNPSANWVSRSPNRPLTAVSFYVRLLVRC